MIVHIKLRVLASHKWVRYHILTTSFHISSKVSIVTKRDLRLPNTTFAYNIIAPSKQGTMNLTQLYGLKLQSTSLSKENNNGEVESSNGNFGFNTPILKRHMKL